MYCSNCGTQMPDTANFCGKCGTALQHRPVERANVPPPVYQPSQPPVYQQPVKQKPGCLVRIVKWAAIILGILIFIGVTGDWTESSSDPGATARPTAVKTATAKPRATATPTAKPTATPRPTNTPKPTEKPFGKEDVELMKTFLSAALQESYSWYDIQGDETGFTINVAGDGVAQAVTLYKSLGKGADSEDWVIVKDSFVELYNLVYQSLETFGMKDPSLMMNIVNDLNHDNYLLIVGEGGTIIYDVLAE